MRDVTGGSRLPFRIRPGAPTSSIDITADGNVGIGTASAGDQAGYCPCGHGSVNGQRRRYRCGNFKIPELREQRKTRRYGRTSGQSILKLATTSTMTRRDRLTNSTNFMSFRTNNTGDRMGIDFRRQCRHRHAHRGRLHTIGTVRFAGVTGCGAGIQSNASGDLSCLASSRQFKNVAGDLPSNVALANIMALRPQTGRSRRHRTCRSTG